MMMSAPAYIGKDAASLAGLLAIVAFVALPWLSLGILGNYTAVQVAQFANQELHTQQLAYLWLELLFPLGAVCCVLLSFVAPGRQRLLALLVLILGTAALVGAIDLYASVSSQNTSYSSITEFIGSGFWVYAVSVALVTAGGAIQLASPVAKRESSYQIRDLTTQGFKSQMRDIRSCLRSAVSQQEKIIIRGKEG